MTVAKMCTHHHHDGDYTLWSPQEEVEDFTGKACYGSFRITDGIRLIKSVYSN